MMYEYVPKVFAVMSYFAVRELILVHLSVLSFTRRFFLKSALWRQAKNKMTFNKRVAAISYSEQVMYN